MKPRFTFQTLILAALVPVMAALTGFWAWQMYHSAHRVILDGFDRKLLAVASSTAALIDGDAHARYQRFQPAAALRSPATAVPSRPAAGDTGSPVEGFDPGDPFYQHYRPIFIKLQSQDRLSYLYTQVYTGGDQIRYILDGTTDDNYSPPGTPDELPPNTIEPAERVQFLGKSWISPIQSWETWGLIKSCFAPIRATDGQVVAMAGADIDISIIRQRTRWAAFSALMVGLVSLILAALVSLRVARTLTRPLQKLKESTLWIAAGYYGAKIEGCGTREVTTLAATLDQLRVRLDEEGRRVLTWQEQIRTERQNTALAQGLEETLSHLGGSALANGGVCTRSPDAVWWYHPTAFDAIAAGCARACPTALALELLAAERPHATLPARLLASHPELEAVACWHDAANTLYYQTRHPVLLRAGATERRIVGAGQLRFGLCPAVQWAEPAPRTPAPASP